MVGYTTFERFTKVDKRKDDVSQVFLFVTHTLDDSLLREFKKRTLAAKDLGPSLILFHLRAGKVVPPELSSVPHYVVTDEDIDNSRLARLVEHKLVPGSNHFLLLCFAERHSFDHYWFIEYDVRFSGDWRLFFQAFAEEAEDFITCRIRPYSYEPSWTWWKTIHFNNQKPHENSLLRSFNPVYRISARALTYVRQCHLDGWNGHHEVLFATVLHQAGYIIRDFGGTGSFVRTDQIGKFYVDSTHSRPGTMRFYPHALTFNLPRNKLIHPVKRHRVARAIFKKLGVLERMKLFNRLWKGD